MSDINNITLTGNLVDDPSLSYTQNERAVCNFAIANQEKYKKNGEEKEPNFINIECWNKLAETVAEHQSKGRKVGIEGRLRIVKNETEERTYINTKVIADTVTFLDYPNDRKEKKEGGN